MEGRPYTIEYRCKHLPGVAQQNYSAWCVWKAYATCELAQRAVDDLRDRYDFYVFRLRTNE